MLNAGDRVRLVVQTIGGWRGTGTVMSDRQGLVLVAKDGEHHDPLVAQALSGEPVLASDRGVVVCSRSELVMVRQANAH